MKARMEVTLDTIWTNQVTASVECELDNPHVLTSQMLAEMMTHRLKCLVGEIRHANERAALEIGREEVATGGTSFRSQAETLSGEPERERQAYEEMRRRQREDPEPVRDEVRDRDS